MNKNGVLAMFFVVFVAFFVVQAMNGQNMADSLLKRAAKSTHDDSIVMFYTSASYHYRFISMDSSVKYGKMAVEKALLGKNELLLGKALLIYGTGLSELGKYEEALAALNKAEKIFIKTKNKLQLGNVNTNISRVYNVMGDYNNAIEYNYRAIKAFEKAGNLQGEVNARMNLITIYIMVKELDQAEKRSLELYPKVIQLNDSGMMSSYYQIYASIFFDSLPDKALENYKKALPIARNRKKFESLAFIQISMGQIYLNKYKLAKNEIDYDKASFYFEEGRKTCEKYKVGLYFSACYNSLSELAFLKNKTNECIEYAQKALQSEIKSKIKTNIQQAYNNLYKAYEKKMQYDSSLYYLKKLMKINDDLTKNEIKTKMMGEEMNYRVEKNNALNKAKIAEKERDITLKNAIIIILSCLAIIIFLLVAFFYMRYQKEKQKQFSILLIQTQEEERKRISKDLHDGIGQNLLMIKSECGNNTPLVEITIEELRTISRNLHPVQLEKLGLKEALESVVENVERTSSIFFSHEIEDINALLSSDQQINLYRIIQECISNIIKHSQAKSARITVVKQGDSVIATIYDDGVGFNISSMKKKKTLGLTSMAERVKLMNGGLMILSGNKGTRTEIKIKYA